MADWTNRLEPILRAQEIAPEYDIHTYSDLVLTQVGHAAGMDIQKRFSMLGLISDENTGENENIRLSERRMSVQKDSSLVDFAEIVDQDSTSSAEVCRVFLACLMLANMGNLDVIQPIKNSVTKKATNKKKEGNKKDYLQDQKGSFSVRLLKSDRCRHIEEFRAPSMV